MGNGDGTFTEKTPGPAVGSTPTSIAVVDFNGDGKADLAIPNDQTGTLTLLLGNGDGTFTPAADSPITLWAAGNRGTSVILTGDFNGDGKADFVIGERAYNPHMGVVLWGDGSGSFVVSPLNMQLTVDSVISSFLVAGDFNGDGATDLTALATLLIAVPQSATATIEGLAVPVATGSHQVVANYAGDGSYASSTSNAVNLDAIPGTPTVALSSSPSQVFTRTAVTLTATVTGSGLTPTGTVRFYAGSNQLGVVPLNGSGTATYATSSLPAGNNSITASYSGDTNYSSANSPIIVVAVASPGTGTPTMTVTPSASNVTDQQGVTVAVTVAGASGQPSPTGVLALATGSYNVQQPLTDGAASFTLAAGVLSSGSNTLTATYLGDATYKSVSATSTVTVSPVLVTASSPASVAPGTAGAATATLSASSTYSGTLKLTCALTNSPAGAQSLPTCTVNPASVAITAGGNGTATLNLQTTASSNTALMQPSRLGLWEFGGGSFLAALVMFGVPSRRRRWMAMLVLLLVISIVGATGCGGDSSSKPPTNPTPPPSNPATPATTAGNYTFTLTGTDTANANITVSTNVTLTVQ